MYTPQEIRENMHFEKAVFGGYAMKDVDEYVAAVAEDYSALYKENSVLKSQLKVVVDRLEDYRKQEDSMNKAMIKAQQAADELVAETERRCARMLSDSEMLLRKRKEELQAEIDEDARRVALVKQTAVEFVAEVQLQVQRCQQQLDRIRATMGEESVAMPLRATGSRSARAEGSGVRTAVPQPPKAEPEKPAVSLQSARDADEQALKEARAAEAAQQVQTMSEEIDRNITQILEQLAAGRAGVSAEQPAAEPQPVPEVPETSEAPAVAPEEAAAEPAESEGPDEA